jgi:hypothetical protein
MQHKTNRNFLFFFSVLGNLDPRLAKWVEFLRLKKVKGIPKDTWNLFLDFLHNTTADYTNYDNESQHLISIIIT